MSVSVLAVLTLTLALLFAPAAPAAVTGSVAFSNDGSCTYRYWTVPADVTLITATVVGGAGGHSKHTGHGGLGASVVAELAVTPGDQLAIDVGQWGSASSSGGCGIAHGGARGDASSGTGRDGYGGGSGSILSSYDARTGAITQLIVAGGGGGGGGNGQHGGGPGADGGRSLLPGTSGTGVFPGSGGGSGGCSACRVGPNGTSGGDSVSPSGAGGGGGGGYPYSGAGGNGGPLGGGGGGGAGESYTAPGVTVDHIGASDRACAWPDGASADCDGHVTLEWDNRPTDIAPDTDRGGDGQQVTAGSSFPLPLTAVVTNAERQPVDGVAVTFTLPGAGAGAAFTHGPATTATTLTGPDGRAVSPPLEANGIAGPWRATASAADIGSTSFKLTNAPAPTVTHLSTASTSSVAGEPVTFSAKVATATAPHANWTGTVQFLLDGAPVGAPVPVGDDGDAATFSTRFGIDGSSVGAHTVQAVYAGDANHLSSRSNVVTQTVAPAATATTVTASPRVSDTGEAVTLTAQVRAEAAAAGAIPAGTVDFLVSPAPGAPAVLLREDVELDATGRAVFVTPSLGAPGAYDVRVAFSGSPSFAASTGTATQNVGPAATSTLVTSSVNPSVSGEPFVLTATVGRANDAGAAPVGDVTFSAGGRALCPTTPVHEDDDPGDGDGVATCTVAGGLAAQPNLVTVAFTDPDPAGGYDPSQGSLTQQIVAARTATTLTATPSTGVFGTAVRVRARVAPVAPGAGIANGTVQFLVDDLAVGLPVEVVRGVATSDPIAGLTVGAHRIEAVYEDDSDPVSMRASSGALTYTVQRAATTLAIASDAEPAPAGHPVVLTAHAEAGGEAGPVSGTVQFLVDGAAAGDAGPLRDGRAQSPPLRLPAGAPAIVAPLTRGTRFAPALASFTQHVSPAPPFTPPSAAETPRDPAAAAAERPLVLLETAQVEAGPDGVANVVLGCRAPAGAGCAGRLALTSRTRLPARLLGAPTARGWRRAGVVLGSERYAVAAGERRAVRVQLTRAAERVLVAQGSLRLTATAAPADAAETTVARPLRVLARHAPALWLSGAALTASRDGSLSVRVRCPAWARCAGRLTLGSARARSDARPAASARLRVSGGAIRTVRLRLDPTARRALARAGRQRLRLQATIDIPAGRSTTTRRTVAVTAAAPARARSTR